MGKLVRQDPCKLRAAKNLQKPGCNAYNCVLRIPACCKRIRRRVFYYIEPWHGKACSNRNIFKNPVKLGMCFEINRPRAMKPENNFVGKPVAYEIHKNTKKHRDIKDPRILVCLGNHPTNPEEDGQRRSRNQTIAVE